MWEISSIVMPALLSSFILCGIRIGKSRSITFTVKQTTLQITWLVANLQKTKDIFHS
ncbi:hypothetical protein LINPERPRIM_LOCUS8788 [Linum perenne]